MKREIAMEWADALESGQYVQGFNVLHNGHCHCALGVLCEIMGEKPQEHQHLGGELYYTYATFRYSPPPKVKEGSDLEDSDRVAFLNDEERFSFPQIAEYIRNNWSSL